MHTNRYEKLAGSPRKLIDNFVPWKICCALGYVRYIENGNSCICFGCIHRDECDIETSYEQKRAWAIEWLEN